MADIILPDGVPVTPSNAKIATTSNFVDALSIVKPEEFGQLVRAYGNDQSIQGLNDLVAFSGGMKAVKDMGTGNATFTHTEDTWIHVFLTAAVATAPVSGQAATTFTVPAEFLDSTTGTHSVQVGDVIEFAINKQKAIVTAVPADNTFTAQPYKSNWSFTAADNAAQLKLSVIGQESLEGADAPTTGLTQKVKRFSGNTMIMTNTYSATGSGMTDKIWFEVGDGKYVWTWANIKAFQTRFKNYMELMSIQGTPAEGAVATAGYKGQKGLIYKLQNDGNVLDLGSDAISMQDIDRMIEVLNSVNGAKEYILTGHLNLIRDVSDMLSEVNAAVGGRNFGAFDNSDDLMAKLDFQGFVRSGYKFATKVYDPFNRQDLGGHLGYDNWGFVIPLDQATARGGDLNGQSVPSLCVRYKEAEGYSRMYEAWNTGAANGIYTNTTDGVSYHARTERGLQVFGAHRYFLIKGE